MCDTFFVYPLPIKHSDGFVRWLMVIPHLPQVAALRSAPLRKNRKNPTRTKCLRVTDVYLIPGISPSWHLRDQPLWFWIGLNPGIQYINISCDVAQKAVWLKRKIIRFDHWLGAEIAELLLPFVIRRMNKTLWGTHTHTYCGLSLSIFSLD